MDDRQARMRAEAPPGKKVVLVIITGTASSGKSSLCEELRKRGISVVPEAATQIIESKKYRGIDIKKLTHSQRAQFQTEIYELQRTLEIQVLDEINRRGQDKKPSDEVQVVFADRSLADGESFNRQYKLGLDHLFKKEEIEKQNYYPSVFMLESASFEQSNGRLERDPETVLKQEKLLREVYSAYGFHIVNVPTYYEEQNEMTKSHEQKVSDAISNRADFILRRVGELLQPQHGSKLSTQWAVAGASPPVEHTTLTPSESVNAEKNGLRSGMS